MPPIITPTGTCAFVPSELWVCPPHFATARPIFLFSVRATLLSLVGCCRYRGTGRIGATRPRLVVRVPVRAMWPRGFGCPPPCVLGVLAPEVCEALAFFLLLETGQRQGSQIYRVD